MFSSLPTLAENIADMVVALFTNLTKIFVNVTVTESTGAITYGNLTFVGEIAVIALIVSLVFFVLGWIRGLIRGR